MEKPLRCRQGCQPDHRNGRQRPRERHGEEHRHRQRQILARLRLLLSRAHLRPAAAHHLVGHHRTGPETRQGGRRVQTHRGRPEGCGGQTPHRLRQGTAPPRRSGRMGHQTGCTGHPRRRLHVHGRLSAQPGAGVLQTGCRESQGSDRQSGRIRILS